MPSEFISPTDRHTVGKIYRFFEILRSADLLGPDEFYYFEKPWKWGREHQAWVAAGRPNPPEDGDPTDLSWERFTKTVAALHATDRATQLAR